jgi:MFS family permease
MSPHAPKSPFAIRNVRMFIAFRVFFNARFYYPVFTILFLDFGLTLSQFAVLNAVWAAAIVLLEVPSGALADTIGRRNLLVFAGSLMVVEIALIALVPLGNATLIFSVWVVNRILSGAAEAAASGADEALAYDSLSKEGRVEDWGRVLEWQMRMKSIAFIAAMSIGAAAYDPTLVQRVGDMLGLGMVFTQETTLKFPIYLTLVMAVVALWSTLRMRETDTGDDKENACLDKAACGRSVVNAFKLTIRAGGWILKTPFALVVILFGVLFDHIIRMIITMASQYYRLIDLPEASFGLIGSALAILGIFIPRMARSMADKRSPAYNLGVLTALTLVGLVGMTFFMPVIGLVPVFVLSAVMYFAGFFISHYLNAVTDSSQRATVLSFKGLSFNLAYGLIGIAYSLLLAFLRSDVQRTQIGISGDALQNVVFTASISWFPWYFIVLLVPMLVFARRQLRENTRPPVPEINGAA